MKKEHVEYLANIVWANDELSAVSASQNDILNNAENVTKPSKRKIEWLWKIKTNTLYMNFTDLKKKGN